MTQPEALQLLLNSVATGEVTPEIALQKLKYLTFEPIEDFAKIDHHRQLRTGFPEVIWGPGKTPAQIVQIMTAMVKHSPVVMATRIEPSVYEQLQQQIPNLYYYPVARICAIYQSESVPHYPGSISILTAGTADLPVAEEAAITATLCGFQVERLWDVGVAGIHRLWSNRQVIAQADVLIVVAGMEGALPSVVAGMADCPVIAVPTSVGYGANFAGVAPLLTMLNSCATGIGVVNIDNGFGAAILAGQILRTGRELQSHPSLVKTETNTTGWKLAYSHNKDGEPITGDITTLINAVRQGCQVRLLIDFPQKHEFQTEAQNLWIKNDIVYAQNTTQISVGFKGEVLAFTKDACHSMIVVSTQGNLDMTRWLLGKHKPQTRMREKVAISWFVG